MISTTACDVASDKIALKNLRYTQFVCFHLFCYLTIKGGEFCFILFSVHLFSSISVSICTGK